MSFIIALLMVKAVHIIAVWIDTVDAIKSSFPIKAMIQLVVGIGAPAIFDLVLISLYFLPYSENIITNGFMGRDFPIIMFMLLLLNAFYILYSIIIRAWVERNELHPSTAPEQKEETHYEGENDIATNTLLVKFQNTQIRLLIHQFLFIHRIERKSHIVKMTGKDYSCQYSITELAKTLSKHGFAQLNRGAIINLKAVKGYKSGERKHTLELILNENYSELFMQYTATDFTVTNEYIESFKKQFSTFYAEN
ncbi:LytTR family transcriptional regulator DNA-binding domain-containing protein [Flavobacterium zepuense]|uniref:LytTR family transcriptional regulator DNA-binding domain-containing protein n=1 Tax=Flavobacterium zepuense TaxID=2593302 RepID=UPI00163DCA8F|nr:LytTR family transcriptional regulator DNA-binding domain-containing protein [Flavobacterium zepuense]